jgi:hypothetical protein
VAIASKDVSSGGQFGYLGTSTGVMGLFAVAGTVCYLAWRALCRLVARLLGGKLSPGTLRVFANGVFAAANMVLVLQPAFYPGDPVPITVERPGELK